MHHVFFPNFDAKKEIKWTKALLQILTNTHPEGPHGITIYQADDIRSLANGKSRICFRTVVSRVVCNMLFFSKSDI